MIVLNFAFNAISSTSTARGIKLFDSNPELLSDSRNQDIILCRSPTSHQEQLPFAGGRTK